MLALAAGASCSTSDGARPSSTASTDAAIGPEVKNPSGDAGIRKDTVLHLAEGGTVRGALAAVYDHSAFWDASTRKTYGIFDPTRFAPYPLDETIRFFASTEISSIENITAAPAGAYVDFLRKEGIVLRRPPLEGVSFVIEGNEGYHLEEDGYGNFAWDLVRTFPDGSRFKGVGAANTDYATWDEPVVLPTAGIVIEVVRSAPDNVPGAYPQGAVNNMVGVYLGGQYYVYILHFKQDSIPMNIEVGTHLEEGAYLGRAGNSGVTLEPHVHTTLLYYTLDVAEPRTWSVPGEFANTYVSDAPGGATRMPYSVPKRGQYVSRTPF